ncbi:unnamed protein product [Ceratitis capitata]|uniref:(Mediterranean fruit fly) hypothetical protein n=1 Tax=Ceratitis capitata TaxID=7213 RepID=A0A811V1N6_CERCA|nr:unnamed protein product [Ceratitis capitata]
MKKKKKTHAQVKANKFLFSAQILVPKQTCVHTYLFTHTETLKHSREKMLKMTLSVTLVCVCTYVANNKSQTNQRRRTNVYTDKTRIYSVMFTVGHTHMHTHTQVCTHE